MNNIIPVSKAKLVNGEVKIFETTYINVSNCPHLIFDPVHYREEDGTCKCNDPNEKIMKEWGYKWSKKKLRWESRR